MNWPTTVFEPFFSVPLLLSALVVVASSAFPVAFEFSALLVL